MERILKNLSFAFIVACIACGCNDTLDVQQKYSFELQTLPVQRRIKQDETVEIRCQIVKEGDYSGTKYFIRYFQPDGSGELRLDDGRRLTPNDLFQLKKDTFRLYYTSRCDVNQTIDIYIEDSFGQVVQKRFSFSHEKEEKEE